MFSSEDEQDDNNVFDQLKSIKPFTIDQLYLLHPDVGCPPSLARKNDSEPANDDQIGQDEEIYQNLVEYEQLRHKLTELRGEIKRIYKKTHEHVDKVWVFKTESSRKIGMCQQGKIAETTFQYKQAFVSNKQLVTFALSFGRLVDAITKDYIYYSFEGQMKRNKIATRLSIAYQIDDIEVRHKKLKSTLITLIEFIRHLGDSKSEFVLQCRQWFRALAKRLLDENTTANYCFIIGQLARGPAGTAEWCADLIECKPFEQTNSFESVPQYITHCSALLTGLFEKLRSRIERAAEDVTESCNPTAKPEQSSSNDQKWSLVDPRFSCTEELNINSNNGLLSEADVINLCLRVPVVQIFRAYVKKCLASGKDDSFCMETDKNYEYIMLKILTIGTIIIKTYQVGLETFNSIQYGSLIEYLSSQIRRTVIILSEKWTEFKNRLKGVDDALLMRLQVEYDNFMLRSILIILELRQSGIWRHLSRIERRDGFEDESCADIDEGPHTWTTDSLRPAFAKLLQATGLTSQSNVSGGSQQADDTTKRSKRRQRASSNSLTYEFSIEWFREVSEPMLWHILWQFYHNAFVSSCDYNSDHYWLDKFKENSVVYLFVNKIKDSPPGECSYLLNSITSILLSRTRPDSKLIDFIATEIFNLSYKHANLRSKVTKLGTRSLQRSAEKFHHLISLYLNLISELEETESGDLNNDVIDLIKGCSLQGWLCNDDEFELLSSWLIELPVDSVNNKLARIVISKILLNSPETTRDLIQSPPTQQRTAAKSIRRISTISSPASVRIAQNNHNCFVDLRLRRKLALLLFETTKKHYPENEFGPQSLGAFVELAFGGLYCEQNATTQDNLLDLATDVTYQQFYVWTWRLLFTLRLHILNLPETDWNDLKSRSGTSRSIKNTVLMDDSFHPAPTIQDSECLSLADGLKNSNPIASFIYLMLTDATWQSDTIEDSLTHLNVLVQSGHVTPSLMAMQFFTICHLNELCERIVTDKKCLDYFTSLIMSQFDATRLASLIMSQVHRLKQFRQLQLSQFYIRILFQVSNIVSRQVSSTWFAGNVEPNLDKISCLLDYLVKFNFSTQRTEIIHKFYDCAYTMQDGVDQSASSWFGSFLSGSTVNTNSSRREFLTSLHFLSHKFKKYTWLRWITTECDTLRLEKIWEDLVVHLSCNEDSDLDSAIKRVCPQVNASILKQILPIHSWTKQIFDMMESDLNHPLCPLIWYNFFLHYFANSLNGTSVGYKLVQPETCTKLMSRLDSLFNYHLYKHRNWSTTTTTPGGRQLNQSSLAQLYRAYKLWLQDLSLRDAYVDMDKLRDDYLVPLLKAVMESSSGSDACLKYIDLESIETQSENLMQVWLTATRLTGNHLIKDMIFVESHMNDSMEILTSVDDEASEASALIMPKHHSGATKNTQMSSGGDHVNLHQRGSLSAEDELTRPLREDLVTSERFRSLDESLELIRKQFNSVFEEANMFDMNIGELDRTKSEIIDLVKQLYKNKKREIIRVVPCSDGNECLGPARIKFDVEEAMIDERKSHCITDRRRQCQELVGELLLMPKNRSIQSAVLIERTIKQLIGEPTRARHTIETLLNWISDTNNFNHLSGNYYVANHLLKTCLELLSSTADQVDAFNLALMNACLQHPDHVQLFSPHVSPSSCSNECFLQLYQTITSNHETKLGPTASFVMLSKFDLGNYLDNLKQQQQCRTMQQDLIKATCAALRGLGKDPDESYELAMGLFRRHLQIELALPDRRKPEELLLVINQFLHIMSEEQLAPKLWLDVLRIMGFETRRRDVQKLSRAASSPNKASQSDTSSLFDDSVISFALKMGNHDGSSIETIIDDVARQSECQSIFDYQSLDSLIKMLTDFMCQQNTSSSMTLLELYSFYLDKYCTVMLSVTFMWLRAMSEYYPENHELIWKQFMSLWGDWVFLSKNCQNVASSSYSLVANYYVASIGYMIHKLPNNCRQILQSVLASLAEYVAQTREVVYLELTILQRSLKNLPWTSLLASPDDFEHLSALCEQKNFNVSDLVSHIILQLDAKQSLMDIDHQTNGLAIPRAAERFARAVILQSTYLKGYRLPGSVYFRSIELNRIEPLVDLILQRMEAANLEHNQNNKLLVNLLRFICIRLEVPTPSNSNKPVQQQYLDESYKRSMLYAKFVSTYLIELIRRYPAVAKNNSAYLAAVLTNSIQDLKPLLLASDLDLSQKTIVYETLLECCSNESIDVEARLLLSRLVCESNVLVNRPLVVLEILHASGQILRDARVLVKSVEELILIYLATNGHYEKVWKSFCLKVLPSDIYLTSCIELKSPLAMLVYFESLLRGKSVHISSVDSQHSEPNDSQCNAASMQDSNISTLTIPFNSNRIWSSFFHWLAQLVAACAINSPANADSMVTDAKLAIVLPRMLELLEPHLWHFLHGENCSPRPERRDKDFGDGRNDTTAVEELNSGVPGNKSTLATKKTPNKQQPTDVSAKLLVHHRCLLGLVKQLLALYDALNATSIWSYIASMSTTTSNEHSARMSITALAVATFLTDRTLANLTDNINDLPEHMMAMSQEITRYRRSCLTKLEGAKKSKNFLNCVQFVETIIECAERGGDKVHYIEGVQLITTHVRLAFSPIDNEIDLTRDGSNAKTTTLAACLDKILTI